MISGINGSNLIFYPSAKARIKKGMISGVSIVKKEHGCIVQFHGPAAEWNGVPLTLCGAGNPYEPRYFKSLREAILQFPQLSLIGVDRAAG